MRRGEVWWADAPAPWGVRPAVLLHRDRAYGRLNTVLVAWVTRTVRELPTTVLLTREDGMPFRCEVNLDHLINVEVDRLRQIITALRRSKMDRIDEALRFVLAL